MLRHARKVSPDSAVVLITAVDDYEAAMQAVKVGRASNTSAKARALLTR